MQGVVRYLGLSSNQMVVWDLAILREQHTLEDTIARGGLHKNTLLLLTVWERASRAFLLPVVMG